MKVLVDTNILMDVMDNRADFLKDSLAIWGLCRDGKINGYISALSIPNIIYIMRKNLTPEKTEDLIRKMTVLFEVADLKASDLIFASQLRSDDFEDAVQMITAERIGADYIVTRNTRDFSSSNIHAIEPAEFLEKL